MRRPLCIGLCLVIGWIIMFYDPPDHTGCDRDNITLIACVEEINGMGDELTLVAGDVVNTDRTPFCDRIKIVSKTNYKTKERICSFSDLKIGNIISVTGKVSSFTKPGNPGQFDEEKYYTSLGIAALMRAASVSVTDNGYDRIADMLMRIKTGIINAFYTCLPDREAGILTAMVLGEKSGLDDEIKELYRENGIAHILAISGLHVSLIGMGLFFILRRYVMPMRPAAFITGIIMLMYGVLTGFPVATKRAVIMMLIMLAAKVIGKRFDRLNALALACLITLIGDPMNLWETGFLLSYGTVLGIVIFVGCFESLCDDINNGILRAVFRFSAGSIGVSIVTLPIIACSYHEIAVYSTAANVLLLPFMSVLLGMGVLTGALSFIRIISIRWLFGVIYYILRLYETVCGWINMLPFNTLIIGQRTMTGVVIYYVVLLLIVIINDPGISGYIFRGYFYKKRLVCSLIIILINTVIFLAPVTAHDGRLTLHENGISITNLDIGQGDCTCIRLDDGRVILIDGGSSDVSEVARYRIVPYLKYYGIKRIDHMIMTHSDSDHISGFEEILNKDDHFGLELGHIVIPRVEAPDDNYLNYERLIKQKAEEGEDIKTEYIEAGDELKLGEVTLTCLHPAKGYRWEDANDYSTVLMLKYKKFTGIFTGDLGYHGESEMIAELKLRGLELEDVDYLKVGHHGSKTSSSDEFLSCIKPEIAVASAGKNNRYHHPSKEVINRLCSHGAKFYCTIDSGAVTTYTDGEVIKVNTYK